MTKKPKILIFVDWYKPANRAGGPIRSISGFIHILSTQFNIWVITSDRDLNDTEPFQGINLNVWLDYPWGKIAYLSPNRRKDKIIDLVRSHSFDTIYTNSFFSYHFSILPLLLCRRNKIKTNKIIIAPRGELKPARLIIKPYKKTIFLVLVKKLRLYHSVFFHATSKEEALYIEKQFPNAINKIFIIKNLVEPPLLKDKEDLVKFPAEVKIIFISRIIEYKNLHFVLNVLMNLNLLPHQKVVLDIYGPIESEDYWSKCKIIIKKLPQNIYVQYKGEIPNSEVTIKMRNYHLFFFPTKGENFGHVIIESLLAGTPVLLSDQTPWNHVNSQNSGWAFSLEDKALFIEKIRDIIDMDQENYNFLRKKAREFSINNLNLPSEIDNYRKFFS